MDRKIDINSWKRSEIFNFYGNISNPLYCVSFRQDVTNLYNYCSANHISFYYSLIYLCTKAVNSIEEFLYCIRPDGVYRIDHRNPSFTNFGSSSDIFHIVNVQFEENLFEFCTKTQLMNENQNKFIDLDDESDSLIFFSCIPWIDITGLTNASDLLSPMRNCDSVPRITWGKYVRVDNKYELGIAVEVNHRLVDGLHIGLFAKELSRLIDLLQ